MSLGKKLGYGLMAAGVLVLGYAAFPSSTKPNDIKSNAVMVVNREMNHGGTGLILSSSSDKSYVLTNAHVCGVVKSGGVVVTDEGNYQVHSTIESKQSDLCLLSVLSDLKLNTKISSSAPKKYDNISVSGYPALMPNIISKGHLSGKATIPVFTGVKECTEEDLKDNLLMCVFAGGIPIIKFYESVLTSATIMPGNSGSGVYNTNNELIGVVFAGQGDFGYSWIVPYEQVLNFLNTESQSLPEVPIDQVLLMGTKQKQKTAIVKQILDKCVNDRPTDPKLLEVCALIAKDMLWRK